MIFSNRPSLIMTYELSAVYELNPITYYPVVD